MPKSTAVSEHSQPSSAGGLGRLPVHLTSFIGRKDELSALQALLEQQEVRLLTLTGSGGSGKSRLATRLAAEVGDNYEDGLCWVELADLADASLIVQNIVIALDVGDPTTSPSTELLIQTLRRRQLLLILDNCEHLLDECARLVTQLLKDVPDLYILATSRERLNIPGEMTWAVNGLSVPDSFDSENADDPVAQLLTYDAVALFVARARLVLPSFEVDASLAPFIWKVCVQLDGIPLALELAAARLRTLGVAQIAERVADHLDLLAARSDLLPTRQRTMRATLEWSHELLTELEQDLFRALAVFRGSFSLEAAEAIATVMVPRDGGQWSASAPGDPTADLLEKLVDRSLVVVEAKGSQRTTYRLLETIRVFATEKLASSGQLELAKDTHLGFYHRLTQTAVPELKGPEQQRWVARLEQEYDNLRAALTWTIEQAQTGSQEQADYSRLALEMAANLFWFWNAANYFTEGYNWSQSVLALPGQEKLIAERALTLYTAGTQAWLTGDFATARVHLDESLLLSQQQEDELGIAKAWMTLGRIHLYQGHARQASRFAADCVGLFRELGAEHELGLALGLQSAASAMRGDYGPARAYAQEMLAVFTELGDPLFIALAHIDLGWAAYHQGDLQAAVQNLEQGLALARQVDSRWLIAQSLNYLAEISRFQGEYKIAADYIEECLALAEEVDARAWLAQGTRNLAYVSLYTDRLQEAAGLFLESLDHVRHLGDQAGIGLAMQGLTAIAARERAWSLAKTLNSAVAEWREQSGPPRTPAERDDMARLSDMLAEMPQETPSSAAAAEPGEIPSGDIFAQARQVAALFTPRLIQVKPVSYDLSIYALGPAQALRAGQPLTSTDWNYAKPKELLFYLVAHEARTKAQIGLDFWPDASPTQLRRNFRAALYRLRQALGGREWIVYEGGRYAFNRQLSYWYDVEAFEERIAVASQVESSRPDQAIAEYTRAIRLYRGDFLEDVTLNEWASPRREALQQTFLQACLKRAGIWVDKGDLESAVDAYQEVLGHDNLLEQAHRGLMIAYTRQGNRNQALRHYEDLRQLLADELGAEPAAETQTLNQRIKTNQAV